MNSENLAVQAIKALDLSKIKEKLSQPIKSGGQGWSLKKTNLMEEEYKNFLSRIATEGDEGKEKPSDDLDSIWHTHILDTKKYREDCMEIFGYFLEHIPAYGRTEICCVSKFFYPQNDLGVKSKVA